MAAPRRRVDHKFHLPRGRLLATASDSWHKSRREYLAGGERLTPTSHSENRAIEQQQVTSIGRPAERAQHASELRGLMWLGQ